MNQTHKKYQSPSSTRITRLAGRLTTILFFQKVADILCSQVAKELNSDSAILLYRWDDKKKVQIISSVGLDNLPSEPLTKRDSLFQLFSGNKRSTFVSDPTVRNKLDRSEYYSRLKPFTCDLIIPLRYNRQIVGILMLSKPEKVTTLSKPLIRALWVLGDRAGVSLKHTQMLMDLRRESVEKSVLLELGRKMNSILELDKLMDILLDSLQQVVHYDKIAIFLLGPNTDEIERVARRGPFPLFEEKQFLQKGAGLVAWAVEHKKPVIVKDVSNDSRYFPLYLDTRSEMDVPIIFQNKILGVFNLESNHLNNFTEGDRRLVQALAGQAAIAIENAWLYTQLKEKQEMEKELRTAQKFQRALLPRRMPEVDGYQFAAIHVPSRLIGGDIYDFIRFGDGRLGIAIGDVSGKGTPSAILMATLFSMYRGFVRLGMSVDQMMHDLNNTLKRRISISSFITFFYGELTPKTGEFIYCNAGHCAPIVYRSTGDITFLEKGGTVLGFVDNVDYQIGRTTIQPGDTILLFTDGVTEAMNREEEIFGDNSLVEFLRQHATVSPRIALRDLFQTIQEFTGSKRPQDDFTAVLVQHLGNTQEDAPNENRWGVSTYQSDTF
jgi:sigma-B regulation protein RsbU (phosphoserine phosphatase)